MFRSMNLEDIDNLNYKWKYYKFDITQSTTKHDFIRFTSTPYIHTGEYDKDFNIEYKIDPSGLDVIILTTKNEIIKTRYNHIYKNDSIQIRLYEKIQTWGGIKQKIKTIILLDHYTYRKELKHLWSNRGFLHNLEAIAEVENMIYNEVVEKEF